MKMAERVKKYLDDYGSITTWEAFRDLGCTRLSEYIRQLRLTMVVDDCWIESVNRYGNKVKFKKYFIKHNEDEQ